MAIDTETKEYKVSKGIVEGVKLKWGCFSLLLLTAPKGFLACGIFDLDAINAYGRAAALVEGSPSDLIGTLDRMMERSLSAVNALAYERGLRVGMSVKDSLELLFD
jgi:uncharacterized protein YunC (DUF1805 family)